MRELLIFNLAKRLAIPFLAALGGFLAGQYPAQFSAFCQGVGL